ncbi:MAG: FemAB family PEP-CTERM system-associated protein [Planctomycetota bacterium]|nr:MAG: FemAB family PEP-CTERM system-associated protein [Planctomycetota bacterium]
MEGGEIEVFDIAWRRDRPVREAIERFVQGHPEASAYHRPVVLDVMRGVLGLAVGYLVARDGAGLRGVLPLALSSSPVFGRFATSLPVVNYGGVVLAPGQRYDGTVARALVRDGGAWARRRGARDLTLRHTEARPLALPATRRKETVLLPLPSGDPEALWRSIGPKPRNLVRKARRCGCEARVLDGPGAVGAFHRVYAENLRDLGSPSLPQRWFEALRAVLGRRFAIHVVTCEGRLAGAAVSVLHGESYEVPWASTLRAYRSQAANMLLYWHLMEHAIASGARVFDFGRSTPGSGPYRFKLQWKGARAQPLPWYVVGRQPEAGATAGSLTPDNPRYARAIALWRRLPVPIARVAGGVLTRWLP